MQHATCHTHLYKRNGTAATTSVRGSAVKSMYDGDSVQKRRPTGCCYHNAEMVNAEMRGHMQTHLHI